MSKDAEYYLRLLERDLAKMKQDPFFNQELRNGQKRTTKPVKAPIPR